MKRKYIGRMIGDMENGVSVCLSVIDMSTPACWGGSALRSIGTVEVMFAHAHNIMIPQEISFSEIASKYPPTCYTASMTMCPYDP